MLLFLTLVTIGQCACDTETITRNFTALETILNTSCQPLITHLESRIDFLESNKPADGQKQAATIIKDAEIMQDYYAKMATHYDPAYKAMINPECPVEYRDRFDKIVADQNKIQERRLSVLFRATYLYD